MITFENIQIEGFGSVISKVKYKFNKQGLNIIAGPNGVGKTTIINALAWVLYKQLLKKGSSHHPWPHIIDENYKGTKVKLKFTKGDKVYEVIRMSDYTGKVLDKKGGSRLIILEDGEEMMGNNLRNKDDYQKMIVKILGYSFELFKATLLFGQRVKRLMDEEGPAKKKVFDEAFESVFISRARDIVDNKIKTMQPIIVKAEHELDKMKLNKTNLLTQIKQLKEYGATWHSKQAEKITNNKIDQQKLSNKIKSLRVSLNEMDELNGQISIMDKKTEEIRDSINNRQRKAAGCKDNIRYEQKNVDNYKGKIVELEYKVKNPIRYCNTCNQRITIKDMGIQKNTHTKEILALKQKLKEALLKITTYTQDLEKINKFLDKGLVLIKDHQKKVKELYNNITLIRERNATVAAMVKDFERLVKEGKALQDEKPMSDEALPKLRKLLREVKEHTANALDELRVQQKEYKLQQWLNKEPLSNSGLKAFIFDSMLAKVNYYLKAYTQLVGFEIKVYVEMSSSRKDIMISVTKKGNEVPYADLSGGQKQLSDVAIAFALSDTINAIKPTNILIMDEIFESLSAENIEAVSNIVIKKAAHKCIHIISHQNSFNPINSYKTTISLNDKEQTILESKFREQ